MRSLLLALAGAAGTVLVDSGSEKIVSITDTPFPFSTSPYSVTGEAAFASSCPCRWLAGERPDPLLDQILVVNDYSCTTSCSAIYAACAASLLNATGVILSENFDKQFELQNVGMTAAQVEAAKAAQVGAAVAERQQYGAVANTSGCLALPATMLTSNGTQRLLQAANWSSSNINWTDPPL